MTVAPVRALPELRTVDDVRARLSLRAVLAEHILEHHLYTKRGDDPFDRATQDDLFQSGDDQLTDSTGAAIDATRLKSALEVAADLREKSHDELQAADRALESFLENPPLVAEVSGTAKLRFFESPSEKLANLDKADQYARLPKDGRGRSRNETGVLALEALLTWFDMREEERSGESLYSVAPDVEARLQRNLEEPSVKDAIGDDAEAARVCAHWYQKWRDDNHAQGKTGVGSGQPQADVRDSQEGLARVLKNLGDLRDAEIAAGAPRSPAPIDLASIVELPEQSGASADEESSSVVRGVFENVRDAARAATDQVKSNLKSGKPKAKGVKHSDPWYLRLKRWASKRWSDTGNIYRDLGKAAVVFLAVIGVRSVFTGNPASASGGDSSIPTNTIPPGNGSQVANGKGAPRILSGGAAMAALAEAERFRTSTDRAFDDLAQLQQELARWRDEVAPLPTNEQGKRLAREPRNFPAYQDRLKAVRDLPGTREVAGLETRLKRYREQAQELVAQKLAPPPELSQQVEKDRQQILQAVDGYQQARLAIRSFIALAPSGPIKAGEPTLQKAMEIQAEKAAIDYRNTIAEAKKQADELKKAAEAKIIADAAKADANAKIAAAKKEAEEKAAKDPALVAKFKFILGDGLCQFGTGGYVGDRKWDQPGPCGFKNLNARTPTSTAGVAREAVLGDFKTFIYVACGRSMDNAYRTYANNDRGGFHTFPPTLENGQPDLRSPEAKRLRVLFDEAKRYAPIWHRLGMLR